MAADDLHQRRANQQEAGLKSSQTKGSDERSRAARMAAWTREHGKDDDRNPHSRRNGGARYILKPVFWNTAGYLRPSGAVSASGYTADKGYGHEEWNNSPAMVFEEEGERFRAFHTEGVGNLPVEASAGRLFVFMCASHDGVQELVGVAGGATCLIRDEGRRAELAHKLGLDKLHEEAWALKQVRDRHAGDLSEFMQSWRKDLNWIPNWTCPARLFFWPEKPVPLDPRRITSKSKLLTMFGGYVELEAEDARAILAMVPDAARAETWSELARAMGGDIGRALVGSPGGISAGSRVGVALRAARTWIFQAQPLRFRVDEFLSRKPATFHWLATTHAGEIEAGDRVYVWRAIGGGRRDESGVFAEAVIEEPARLRTEPEEERAFWVDEADRSRVENRVVLRLVRAVDKGRLLKRRWIEDDPLLSDLTILDSPRRTNYPMTEAQAGRLGALWDKLDRPWDRAEAVAALCVFERAGGSEIPKGPGSACVDLAIRIARAVADMQSHARTFAEISSATTPGRAGIGTPLHRQTWAEFFDPALGRLRGDVLWSEYRRLWETAGAEPGTAAQDRQPEAAAAVAAPEEEPARYGFGGPSATIASQVPPLLPTEADIEPFDPTSIDDARDTSSG